MLKKIFFSSLTRFIFQIFSIFVFFFLTPYTIKTIGDYYYGIWVFISILVSYLEITDFGISSSIDRHLSIAIGKNDKEYFNKIFISGFLLNIIIILIIFVSSTVICSIIFLLKIKNFNQIIKIFLILSINISILTLSKSFLSVLISNLKFELISFINFIQLTMLLILTILFLNNNLKISGLALANLLSNIISLLLIITFSIKIQKIIFDFKLIEKNIIYEIMKYSGKTFLAQLADILRFKLSEVITGTFISINKITHFNIANKLVTTSYNFSRSFIDIFKPIFSQFIGKNDQQNNKYYFFFSCKISLTFSLFLFFSFLFIGKNFILIWMGEKYLLSYYPLIILSISYLLAISQSPSVQFMYASNKHQYWAFQSFFEGIFNFILSIILVLFFKLDIIGVSLGTLIPIIITKIFIQPIIISKLLKIKYSNYYFFFLKNFLIGAILYLIVYLLIVFIPKNNYFFIILNLIILLFIFILHFFIILDKNEKKYILLTIKKLFFKKNNYE